MPNLYEPRFYSIAKFNYEKRIPRSFARRAASGHGAHGAHGRRQRADGRPRQLAAAAGGEAGPAGEGFGLAKNGENPWKTHEKL